MITILINVTMNKKETIKVEDSKGFIYEVDLEHSPHFGFTTAYYRGRIIEQCDSYRILEPTGDDDREWEIYEERAAEWRDEILSNIKPRCKEHFDRQ